MTKERTRHWGRWAAAIASLLVALKTTIFVGKRAFSFAKSEVNARGGDVAFVLGLTERRKSHP